MYIDKAIISKYTSYFHDRSSVAIEYGKNNAELILTIKSAEVDPEDIKDPIALLKDDRIKGIKNIYINNKKILPR